MTTTFQDIRGALHAQAALASGYPAQVAYEGVAFTSTVGTPWARETLLPTSDGPFSVDANTRYTRGLYQVDLNYPSRGSPGTKAVETAADAVIAKFKSGTHLVKNAITVIVDGVARSAVMASEDWLKISVTITWRSYPAA